MNAPHSIHFNPLWAVPSFIASLLNLYVAMLPSTPTMSAVLGVMFLVLGGLLVFMPMLVLHENAVLVKNLFGMTLKTYPFESWVDLQLEGSKLYVCTDDDQRLRVRGAYKWLAKPADWAALARVIGAAKVG